VPLCHCERVRSNPGFWGFWWPVHNGAGLLWVDGRCGRLRLFVELGCRGALRLAMTGLRLGFSPSLRADAKQSRGAWRIG